MAWIIFVGLWVFLSGRKIETVSDKDEFVNVEQAFHTEKKESVLSLGRGEVGDGLRGISQFFAHLRNCSRCGLL